MKTHPNRKRVLRNIANAKRRGLFVRILLQIMAATGKSYQRFKNIIDSIRY